MSEFPKHWKKGIFHQGEFGKYMEVMPRDDIECMFSLKKNEENGIPEMVQLIVMMKSFGELLEKNRKKTVKVKSLNDRYKKQRNKAIIEGLKIGFFGKPAKQEIIDEAKAKKIEETIDKLQDELRGYASKYGKDWEHNHRDNLNKARDTTND